MKRGLVVLRMTGVLSLLSLGLVRGLWGAEDLAPLDLNLPLPVFRATPPDLVLTEHMEPQSAKPRAPFLAPKGTRNVALKQPVTSSDPKPIEGTLGLVTDGNKEIGEGCLLALHRRLQWVQVDLGQPYRIYAVVLWHAYDVAQWVHDVVVQVADDPEFTKHVRTLYNNDYDGSAGLGAGKDKEYWENHEGRLIDGRGEAARYVRCYSQGSTASALNGYTEVEVYGLGP